MEPMGERLRFICSPVAVECVHFYPVLSRG